MHKTHRHVPGESSAAESSRPEHLLVFRSPLSAGAGVEYPARLVVDDVVPVGAAVDAALSPGSRVEVGRFTDRRLPARRTIPAALPAC